MYAYLQLSNKRVEDAVDFVGDVTQQFEVIADRLLVVGKVFDDVIEWLVLVARRQHRLFQNIHSNHIPVHKTAEKYPSF